MSGVEFGWVVVGVLIGRGLYDVAAYAVRRVRRRNWSRFEVPTDLEYLHLKTADELRNSRATRDRAREERNSRATRDRAREDVARAGLTYPVTYRRPDLPPPADSDDPYGPPLSVLEDVVRALRSGARSGVDVPGEGLETTPQGGEFEVEQVPEARVVAQGVAVSEELALDGGDVVSGVAHSSPPAVGSVEASTSPVVGVVDGGPSAADVPTVGEPTDGAGGVSSAASSVDDPVGDGASVASSPTEDSRPFSELRETGLLWLINCVVFHPRGYGLAFDIDTDGVVFGWRLLGDGSEPWWFAPEDEVDVFAAAQRTLAPRGDAERVR